MLEKDNKPETKEALQKFETDFALDISSLAQVLGDCLSFLKSFAQTLERPWNVQNNADRSATIHFYFCLMLIVVYFIAIADIITQIITIGIVIVYFFMICSVINKNDMKLMVVIKYLLCSFFKFLQDIKRHSRLLIERYYY
jgi:hypothetical protein